MGNTLNKDKQTEIEEIASKCITSWLNNETSKALPDYIAEALYNAGYRKASDVAREIFAVADKIFMATCLSLETYKAWGELKKKYTEEGK